MHSTSGAGGEATLVYDPGMPFPPNLLTEDEDLVYNVFQQGMGRIWPPEAILGDLPDGRANAGMDINARNAVGMFGDHAWQEGDLELIAANRVDFLGVNYYSPSRMRAEPESMHFGIEHLENPDARPAFNGEVYPDGLYDALMRIDRDYGAPLIYITENGAGFGPEDDRLVDGRVQDVLRQDYIRRHLIAAHRAIQDGVNLKRYYLWSCFDNFEWIFGYSRRFGLVYVDYDTQERIWKESASPSSPRSTLTTPSTSSTTSRSTTRSSASTDSPRRRNRRWAAPTPSSRSTRASRRRSSPSGVQVVPSSVVLQRPPPAAQWTPWRSCGGGTGTGHD